MMKRLLEALYGRLLPKVLTLLGFSSTFAFMACYGPAPSGYHLEVFPSNVDLSEEEPTDTVTVATDGEWAFTNIPEFVELSDTTGHGTANVAIKLTRRPDSDAAKNATDILTVEGSATVASVSVSVAGR